MQSSESSDLRTIPYMIYTSHIVAITCIVFGILYVKIQQKKSIAVYTWMRLKSNRKVMQKQNNIKIIFDWNVWIITLRFPGHFRREQNIIAIVLTKIKRLQLPQ